MRNGGAPSVGRPGWPLTAATAVIALETLALAVAAVGLTFYQLLGHRPHDPLDAWLVVIMSCLGAVGLALVTRGLAHRRLVARSPAVLTQLIVVPIGGTTLGHGELLIGVPLVLVGVVGLVGLFAPSTTAELGR